MGIPLSKKERMQTYKAILFSALSLVLPAALLVTFGKIPNAYAQENNQYGASQNDSTAPAFETFNHPLTLIPTGIPSSLFPPEVVTIKTVFGEQKYLTYNKTVGSILKEFNFTYKEADIITPNLNEEIGQDVTITITSVNSNIITKSETIPFQTIREADDSMYQGTEEITQEGSDGSYKIFIEQIYHDGQLSSENEVKRVVDVEPVNQIIRYGTKRYVPVTSYDSNMSCSYWDGVADSLTSDANENAWLKRVMRCESRCNPNAVSPNGLYIGLMQFSESTFYNNGGWDIWNGNEQLSIALNMYRAGRSSAWGCK